MVDVKSNNIIEISDPNNPKINTHTDISVISFKFWCDGGAAGVLWPAADVKSFFRNLILNSLFHRLKLGKCLFSSEDG